MSLALLGCLFPTIGLSCCVNGLPDSGVGHANNTDIICLFIESVRKAKKKRTGHVIQKYEELLPNPYRTEMRDHRTYLLTKVDARSTLRLLIVTQGVFHIYYLNCESWSNLP